MADYSMWSDFSWEGGSADDYISVNQGLALHHISFRFTQLRGDLQMAEFHETLPFMDKIILARNSSTGAQIRLHRYSRIDAGDPHDHRWPFSARVLRGSYRHERYRVTEDRQPVVVSTELQQAGSSYYLDWREVHSVTPEELPTWTVVCRGAPRQESFRVFGQEGEVTKKFGAAAELPITQQQKRMTAERFRWLYEDFARAFGVPDGTGDGAVA